MINLHQLNHKWSRHQYLHASGRAQPWFLWSNWKQKCNAQSKILKSFEIKKTNKTSMGHLTHQINHPMLISFSVIPQPITHVHTNIFLWKGLYTTSIVKLSTILKHELLVFFFNLKLQFPSPSKKNLIKTGPYLPCTIMENNNFMI